MQKDEQVLASQRRILNLVGHEDWPVVRELLTDKITALQEIAEFSKELDDCDAQKLLVEMRTNKRCAEILYAWLREIEGSAEQAKESGKPKPVSAIFRGN